MLQTCIKYFFILFCSFYLYVKLLNLKTTKRNYIIHGMVSTLSAFLIYFVRLYFASLSIIITVIIFAIVVSAIYKQSMNTTIVSSLIAMSCSYALFILSIAINFPVPFLLQTIRNKTILFNISSLLVGIIQMLLSTIPFHFKRLKTGMPFLNQHGSSDIGAFIAISLLIATCFFNASAGNNIYLLIPIFFIALCGIIIFFWWKNKLTENYINKLKEREINALQSEIEDLKIYNETLSKIIHKDNKLIPTMELAVENVLIEISNNSNQEDQDKLLSVLTQLQNVAEERKGILHICDNQSKEEFSSGVSTIDSLLQYLAAKAYSEQIHFEVIISDKLYVVIPDIISEEDLRTLIADLAENALIAVKNESKRNVLIHMLMDNNLFCVDFYDSGTPFSKDVLSKLGKQRITTHVNDGGTGIGYMSTFEILKRCNASLIIDETTDNTTYTKKVRICFDGLNNYKFSS